MQTIPEREGPLRFFQIQLQEDMLEGWSLIRESGTQGVKESSLKRIHYECREDAEQALFSLRDQQLRRGYRVTFATGISPAEAGSD